MGVRAARGTGGRHGPSTGPPGTLQPQPGDNLPAAIPRSAVLEGLLCHHTHVPCMPGAVLRPAQQLQTSHLPAARTQAVSSDSWLCPFWASPSVWQEFFLLNLPFHPLCGFQVLIRLRLLNTEVLPKSPAQGMSFIRFLPGGVTYLATGLSS